jgi:hypothetical protein
MQILTNLWVPEVTYKFPLVEKNKTRNLRFQHRWLQLYKWLAYSEIKQGGFCKVCVVFSKIGGIGGQKLYTRENVFMFKKVKDLFKEYYERGNISMLNVKNINTFTFLLLVNILQFIVLGATKRPYFNGSA